MSWLPWPRSPRPRDSRWDSRFDSRLDFRLGRHWPRQRAATPRLLVDLVDPQRAQVQPVRIWIEGGLLQIAGPLLLRQVPLGQVDWDPVTPRPEGVSPQRALRLPDGSWLCATDASAWDEWAQRRDARTPCERLLIRLGRYLWWTLPAAAGGLWWVWRTH